MLNAPGSLAITDIHSLSPPQMGLEGGGDTTFSTVSLWWLKWKAKEAVRKMYSTVVESECLTTLSGYLRMYDCDVETHRLRKNGF